MLVCLMQETALHTPLSFGLFRAIWTRNLRIIKKRMKVKAVLFTFSLAQATVVKHSLSSEVYLADDVTIVKLYVITKAFEFQ